MFYIGLDLGQRSDFTAIAAAERVERARPWLPPVFSGLSVRHLERVPLGTPYPRVVERVAQIAGHPELAGNCCLVVDATGVGLPVVDLLRAAEIGCEVIPVIITGGERESRQGSFWHVPKRDLITGVQVLLEKEQLRIARRLPETGPLVRELMDVRTEIRGAGRARWGAEGCGQHDDLVMAVALACWRGRRAGAGFVRGRLF